MSSPFGAELAVPAAQSVRSSDVATPSPSHAVGITVGLRLESLALTSDLFAIDLGTEVIRRYNEPREWPGNAPMTALAVDRERMFWLEPQQLRVMSRAFDGDTEVVEDSGPGRPLRVTIDETRLYWVRGTEVDASVRARDKVGGPVVIVADHQAVGEATLAAAGGDVYWTTRDALMRARDHLVEAVAPLDGPARGLAIAASHVFVALESPRILRFAR